MLSTLLVLFQAEKETKGAQKTVLWGSGVPGYTEEVGERLQTSGTWGSNPVLSLCAAQPRGSGLGAETHRGQNYSLFYLSS